MVGERVKKAWENREGRSEYASTRLDWHIDLVDRTFALAARGVLPIWRTSPVPTLFRDSGFLSAVAALDVAKIRFTRCLQKIDSSHLLVEGITPPMIIRGMGAGTGKVEKTEVLRVDPLLPAIPGPKVLAPRYITSCSINPAERVDRERAAAAFEEWWAALPSEDVSVFSDGPEQYPEGEKFVGFGYAIYQNGKKISRRNSSINNLSHVFDA